MKLTCRQADLAHGLAAVSHAVAASSELPILANIRLSTDEGSLKLAATNLEIAVTCWVTAQIEEEGRTTVPARLFTEFVSRLGGETLTLDVAAGTYVLHLRDVRSSAHFRGMDATEFPCIPGTEGSEGSLSLEAALLKAVIDQVEFAAAVDETRPALTAVLLEVQAEAEDLGDNENRLNADVCGPGMQLTMNVHYLVDVLSVIGTPEVAIEANTPNQPILMRPVGGDSSHFMIMPMVFNR